MSAGQPVGGRSVNFLERDRPEAFDGELGVGAEETGLSKVPSAPEPRGLALALFAGEGPAAHGFARALELRAFFVWVGMMVLGSTADSSSLARTRRSWVKRRFGPQALAVDIFYFAN